MKTLLVLLAFFACATSVARADELARTLFDLGIVQAGDVATTSGPRVGTIFPGGFVAQDQAGGCVGKNVAPVAGGRCFAFEYDAPVARAGCVNNVFRDASCAGFINYAINGTERLISHWFRNPERARRTEAVINRVFSVVYAGVIWPNNIRVDNQLGKRGSTQRTVTFWSERLP